MREIKFRAWDNHGTMCDVFGVDKYSIYIDEGEPENGIYGVEPTITRDARSAWELMQYTGLKDKNGVEIYEGDIVEYGTSNSKAFYAECIFENAKFQWKIHDTHDTYNDYDILAEDEGNWIEIIGNIYENPELLEAK